eukprot:scaffold333861_cov23-Prasinocladus_malaysianus.AAC.1
MGSTMPPVGINRSKVTKAQPVAQFPVKSCKEMCALFEMCEIDGIHLPKSDAVERKCFCCWLLQCLSVMPEAWQTSCNH